MSKQLKRRSVRVFALAGTISALALTPALAGNISASLPETGTKSSPGSDFTITNSETGSNSVRPTAIAGIAGGAFGRGVVGEARGTGGIAVYGVNSSTGDAGYFLLDGSGGDAALKGVTSAGSNQMHPGNYGSAGYFEITSIENISPALYAQTGSSFTAAVEGVSNGDGNGVYGVNNGAGGSGVHGEDNSEGEGAGVVGSSENGLSAAFSGGAGGSAVESFNGGTGWNYSSDRNLKEHFSAVDLNEVLDRLDAMPVFTYQMKKSKLPTLYLGPMAQDFKTAFGLGENDITISDGSAHGVALAAAKGLYRKLKEDEATIAELKADNETMKQALIDEKKEMASLRASFERFAQGAPALVEARLIPQ